jgi:DNA-binding NarL/FixJ family response regulator
MHIGYNSIFHFVPVAPQLDDVTDTLLDARDAQPAIFPQLIQEAPKAKIIIFDVDPECLSVVDCVELGVTGFLLKEASDNDILMATEDVPTVHGHYRK